MDIQCRCSSCGAQLKAAPRHAGRKVKCPKCSGTILVPVVPAAASESQPLAEARLVRRGSGGSGKGKARPTAEPLRTCANCGLPLPSKEAAFCPSCGCDLQLASVVSAVDDEKRQPATPAQAEPVGEQPTRPSRGGISKRLVWIATGVGAAVLLAMIAGVYVAARRPAQPHLPSPRPQTTLALDWAPQERFTGGVQIGDRKLRLPDSGPVEYPLDPGKHRVVLSRQGYEPVELDLTLKEGERHTYTPQWTLARAAETETKPATGAGSTGTPGNEPVRGKDMLGFSGWLQDFEAAKKKAAAQSKDVLIAFVGSDGFSIRLCYEVLFQKEFRDRVDGRYVLVWIDVSRDGEARGMVEDFARNLRLVKEFRVAELPRVMVTDAAGLPFAVQRYGEGGVEGFMMQLTRWQSARVERDRILQEVQTAPAEAKLAAIDKGLALLRELKLTPFYASVFRDWLAVAETLDPKNEQGALEAVFQIVWMLKLAEVNPDNPDLQDVAKIVGELDAWTKDRSFKNPDRAATMHLLAADRLLVARQSAAALKHLEAGLACQPKDPVLREQLAAAVATIRGVGVGTGFVVGPGMVLTNFHVVEGTGKTLVKLTEQGDPIPAELIAHDTERDIALLKINVPSSTNLMPLPLAAEPVSRGEKVGAFGYAGGGSVGSGLKLTTGIVSATADESTQGMLLLDCRVNPGNSGGPLCDVYGAVVGMVSAKSVGGYGVESYGMALPANVLRRFLAPHVPAPVEPPKPIKPAKPGRTTKTKPPKPVEVDRRPLEWVEIDRMVGRSVLMIVRAP